MIKNWFSSTAPIAIVLALTLSSHGEEPPPAPELAPGIKAALDRLDLPGVEINIDQWCIDIESTVCLDGGLLELIACTKGTKEHESIVAVEALPKHVHTALLLLGAKSGNPARRMPVGDEGTRWVDVPPSGAPIDVSLVIENKEGKLVEHPITDFISPADREPGIGEAAAEKFPTNTFLFAGSVLHGEGPSPKKYLSDLSGNLITIATFGDEVLCLPGVHSHDKGTLMWQINPTHLPAVGNKITLRLRPQRPAAKDSR